MPQTRLFARAAQRRQIHEVLAQASAIGVAFGGEKAAQELIDGLDDAD